MTINLLKRSKKSGSTALKKHNSIKAQKKRQLHKIQEVQERKTSRIMSITAKRFNLRPGQNWTPEAILELHKRGVATNHA